MSVGKRRRAAWATGLSLVLHALFLAGMVLGLRIVPPPEEDRAMEVRLIAPPPQAPPRPEPARPAPVPERSRASGPALHPHVTPAPSASVPTLALPQAAPPAPNPPRPQYGPDGLQPSLSGRLGCDDPLTYHLTAEQRQVCDSRMARLGREAQRLIPDIKDKNKADYDRYAHCQEVYAQKQGAVPKSDSGDDSSPIAGLGYVPSFKECRVQDR